jgi:hypothetical protein
LTTEKTKTTRDEEPEDGHQRRALTATDNRQQTADNSTRAAEGTEFLVATRGPEREGPPSSHPPVHPSSHRCQPSIHLEVVSYSTTSTTTTVTVTVTFCTPSPADTLNLDLVSPLHYLLLLTFYLFTTLPLPLRPTYLPHLPSFPHHPPPRTWTGGPGRSFPSFQPSRHIHLHHLYVLLYRQHLRKSTPPSIYSCSSLPYLRYQHLTSHNLVGNPQSTTHPPLSTLSYQLRSTAQ